MQKITYSRFEQELNTFLKEYLADDSYDLLRERLDLHEKESNSVSEKINEFYREQLQIDMYPAKEGK